jgi:hypothetical protein
MSVLGDLLEIPSDLLSLFKSYPEVRCLYYRASSLRKKPNIVSISNLSMPHREIVRELYPNDRHKIGQIWSLEDCDSVLHYKKYNLEEYFLIKENIPRIIEFGKIAHYLYLERDWHLINFLFSGSWSTSISDLVIWDKSSFGINPILFKKHSLGVEYLEYYYLEAEEVKDLAELIQDFGDEIVCENLQHVSNYLTTPSCFLHAKELCDSIKNFYCKVANNENSVLIKIN